MQKKDLNNLGFSLLLHFAKLGGFSSKVKSSTLEIAHSIGVSQQSVSRKLNEMHSLKLIDFVSNSKGVEVSITSSGKSLLQKNYLELKEVFGKKSVKTLFQGKVSKGLGEGRYYLSFRQYAVQIEKKLGFKPFLGTLNLGGNFSELLENHLSFGKKIEISGFETKDRGFGKIFCHPVKIDGKIPGAIVFPERGEKSENAIELIAPFNLRKKLNLKDGSRVEFFME